MPETFFSSNFEISPKIDYYCLLTHRRESRDALRRFFDDSSFCKNEVLTIREQMVSLASNGLNGNIKLSLSSTFISVAYSHLSTPFEKSSSKHMWDFNIFSLKFLEYSLLLMSVFLINICRHSWLGTPI